MPSIKSLSRSANAISPLLLLLCSTVEAQITLPTLTGCIGNPTGTATFSTSTSIATGSESIPAGDFWNQLGAVWIFSTDTEGIEFTQPGIPGYGAGFGGGGPPAAAESALILDPSKTAWTLSVPASSLGGEWDIVFEASTPTASAASSSTPAAAATTTSAAATSLAAAAKVRRYEPARPIEARIDDAAAPRVTAKPRRALKRMPVGAKFRRQAASSGNFNLIISGALPCQGPASPSSTASGNAAIASSCVNNEISTQPSVWSTYGVQSYMSSLLQAAAPAPTDPQVNGASLIHSDVNPAGAMCTYTAQCAGVSCNGVKDDTSGSIVSVQRYLAWNAVANLNNYLYALYEALFNAGTLNGLLDGKIVTTFFTNPSPDATWMQILNTFTPLITIFSAMLGPFSAGGSALLGIFGGIASGISAGGVLANLAPVVDQRFTEFATIEDFVGSYLNATIVGIESAYNNILGPDTSAVIWAGSTLGDDPLTTNGYFGTGEFVDSNFTEGLTDNLYTNLANIFNYKAVNFAWNDSGVFIMYVPYGKPIADTKGNIQTAGVDASYCQNSLSDTSDIGTLTICDAPGPGMARIFNAGTVDGAGDLDKTSPMGWNSGEAGINVASVIRGSVNSFFAGDFNYDAANPYNAALSSGQPLSPDQLNSLAALKITEETAGIFNLPVCQIYDLRYFPPASGNSCSACLVSVGGTPGSTATFGNNINKIVSTVLNGPPNTETCGGEYDSSCFYQCPTSLYNGTAMNS